MTDNEEVGVFSRHIMPLMKLLIRKNNNTHPIDKSYLVYKEEHKDTLEENDDKSRT